MKNQDTCSSCGMESLTELYKAGRGPSSSHTMGPERACLGFLARNPSADRFRAVLFGSLAKTGEGHGTDRVIKKTFAEIPCDVEFDRETSDLPHPNTMDLYAYRDNSEIDRIRVMSVGGGKILAQGDELGKVPKNTPERPLNQP